MFLNKRQRSEQSGNFFLEQVPWLAQALISSVLVASLVNIRSCLHWTGQKLIAGKGISPPPTQVVGKHLTLWA